MDFKHVIPHSNLRAYLRTFSVAYYAMIFRWLRTFDIELFTVQWLGSILLEISFVRFVSYPMNYCDTQIFFMTALKYQFG